MTSKHDFLIKPASSNVYNQLVLLLLSDITQLVLKKMNKPNRASQYRIKYEKVINCYTLYKLIYRLHPRKVKRKRDYLAWRNPSISILQINGQPEDGFI